MSLELKVLLVANDCVGTDENAPEVETVKELGMLLVGTTPVGKEEVGPVKTPELDDQDQDEELGLIPLHEEGTTVAKLEADAGTLAPFPLPGPLLPLPHPPRLTARASTEAEVVVEAVVLGRPKRPVLMVEVP